MGYKQLTSIPVVEGGIGRNSQTAYAVLCGGTTTTAAQQSIASVGTAAQVLTSNGAGALPTFQTPAGGGGAWEFISSADASALASVSFTGLSSSYYAYKVMITNVVAAAAGKTLWMRTSANNGISYDSTGGNYRTQVGYNNANNFVGVGSSSNTAILLTSSSVSASGNPSMMEVTIFNPSAATYTGVSHQGIWNDGSNWFTQWISGIRLSAAAVDAVQFLLTSGNFTSGTFKLYGLLPS